MVLAYRQIVSAINLSSFIRYLKAECSKAIIFTFVVKDQPTTQNSFHPKQFLHTFFIILNDPYEKRTNHPIPLRNINRLRK
jgi:hypothetical protein